MDFNYTLTVDTARLEAALERIATVRSRLEGVEDWPDVFRDVEQAEALVNGFVQSPAVSVRRTLDATPSMDLGPGITSTIDPVDVAQGQAASLDAVFRVAESDVEHIFNMAVGPSLVAGAGGQTPQWRDLGDDVRGDLLAVVSDVLNFYSGWQLAVQYSLQVALTRGEESQ